MPSKAKLTTRSISTSTVSTDTLPKNSGLTNAELDSNFLNLRDQTFGIVGDDSTGIDVKAGDTVTIAGTQNITTAVTGDTVTITGPDLTSYITASSSDTLTNKTISGSSNTLSNIANSSLTHSQISFVGDDSTGTAVSLGETIKFAGSGGATVAVSGDTVTITAGGGGGDSIGNLEVVGANLQTIQGTITDADIIIEPNSSGNVYLKSHITRIGDLNQDAVLTTNGTGALFLHTNNATDSGYIKINPGTGYDIELIPHGSGRVKLDNDKWPNTQGGNGDIIQANGDGTCSWVSLNNVILFDVVSDDSTRQSLYSDSVVKFQGGTGISTAIISDGINDPVIQISATGGANTGSIVFDGASISSSDSTQININDNVNIDGNLTFTGTITGDGSGLTGIATSGDITVVGDDSTGTAVSLGETFKIAGTQNVTTAVSGDTLTITGPNLTSYATQSYVTSQGYITASSSDTLTNKTVDLDLTTFSGTKSISEFNTILSGNDFATLAGTETLTNKTINSASNTITITESNISDLQNYLTDIVNDTTPQLGGDLDVQLRFITTSQTNGNVRLKGDGTGRVVIGSDPTAGSTGFYGNNAVYGAQMNYRDADWNAATGPQYPNPLARTTDWKLDASTTTNGRLRMVDAVELDMAGYNWNFSADKSAGPSHKKAVVLKNTGNSASNTLENTVVQSNNVEILGSGSNNSTITINNVIGNRVLNFASQDAGDTTNIGTDYGYLYQSPQNFGSGTLNVTNEYGIYIDQNSSTATNNYGIYHNGSTDYGIYINSNAPNNRIGGVQMQFNRVNFSNASDPPTSTGLSRLYSKGTGPSGTQELYVKTGDGVITKLAPHNTSSQWEFTAPVALVVSSDPSTVTDTAHIYAKDDAASAEVYVRDEAGNVTKISPHNPQGEWEYYSVNTNTGKTVRVNMEKMIRKLEEITGETFIENE